MTPEDIIAQFEAAAISLKHLKASRHTWPDKYRSAWPDIVQGSWDLWLAYGRLPGDEYYQPTYNRPAPPSSVEIDAMDEVLTWIEWLGQCQEVDRIVAHGYWGQVDAERIVVDRRRVIWARACRIPWRKLEDQTGRSVATLRRMRDDAIVCIIRRVG